MISDLEAEVAALEGLDLQALRDKWRERFGAPPKFRSAGTLRLPLFGNQWHLAPGHRIRLDLVQVDNPTFRPANVPSSIDFGPPSLVLPTREATNTTIPGATVG